MSFLLFFYAGTFDKILIFNANGKKSFSGSYARG